MASLAMVSKEMYDRLYYKFVLFFCRFRVYRLVLMNYRYWMEHVQLYRGVTLKYQHAVGQMIQQEISLGLEDKNQHFQMVLDHRQVSLTFFFSKEKY